jgi:hypothetical protein
MSKRKTRPKKTPDLDNILEDHRRYVENQARVKPQIADAKKQIDLVSWDQVMTFRVTGPLGKLLCVYDSIPTLGWILEIIEDLKGQKVDSPSYSYRASILINFGFYRKMQDALQELTWEISDLLMLEDIFDDFSAYEALAGRQRIPPRFLNTSKLVADRLRKERWTATMGRGMRGKDRKPRRRRLNIAPAHERNRLKILSAIRTIRSMPDEQQDEILNNKSRLAEIAGISYHTLRRCENQGAWTTEELIAEISPRTERRADKK